MSPGETSGSPPPHPGLEAFFSGILQDRVLQSVGLILTATAGFLLADSAAVDLSRILLIVQIALVMIALQWGLQRIPQREERRFWTDLTIGCSLWAAAILLTTWSTATWAIAAGDAFRAFFYLAFLFAVERDLERRPGLHPVDYGRTLRWPGGTVFVFGLLTYFVLIPFILTEGITTLPSSAMFLILDAYLGGRFWLRRRQIRYVRWRLLYGLLSVSMATLFLIDGAFLVDELRHGSVAPWSIAVAAWTLPLLFLLLAGRLRHQPMPMQESLFDSIRRKDELSLPKERMVFFALAFPVIHLLASILGLVEPASRPVREVTILGWLVLVGALALVQQRLLEKKARSLWMERMRAEEALHKSEETLRLINERVQAERALRISEEKFAKAFRASPDSVVISTFPEGRIVEINDGTETLTGYPREEIVNKTAVELGLWVDPDRRAQLVTQLRESGSARDFTFELRRRSGEVAVSELSAELLELAGEDHLLMIVRDVTDQKKLEQQVLNTRNIEGLATLASGLAHDLNNVLTPIVMTVQLLRNQVSEKNHQSLLTTLEKNVLRGASMVRDVMSLARGVEGERTRIHPEDLLADMEKIFQESFPSEIRVRMRTVQDKALQSKMAQEEEAEPLWQIEGDATQLHRALLNLCENSRDAILERGLSSDGRKVVDEIIIEAENLYLDHISVNAHPGGREGNYVALSVIDHGVGIPLEIQDRVFDPFFTTKSIGQGTGLGLSTTQVIVKSHDGFMNLYSEPGNGTRVQIFLPARADVRKMVSTEHLDMPFGRGEMILVIDDEVAVREITRQALETFGYRSLIAADGAGGVEIFRRRRDEIDLVLLDMIMPIMNGEETLAAMREIDPSVRVIAMSGLDLKERKQVGESVQAFLAKPFTAVKMLSVLYEALRAGTEPADTESKES